MALDQGYHVPFTVCRTEIHGAAAVQVHRFGQVRLVTNFPGTFFTVRFTEKERNVCFHVSGIRNIHFPISETCFHSFQLLMHRFRILLFSQSQMPQYVQRHQDNQAVSVRRNFTDFISPVIQTEGFHPFRFVILQIFWGKIATRFMRKPDYFPGNISGVKAVAVAFCQSVQRFSHLRKRYNVSRFQAFVIEKRFQHRLIHRFIFQSGNLRNILLP